MDKFEKFYNNPETYIPIDEMGDLYLNYFRCKYAALRMLKNLPIFERAHKVLTEGHHYSHRTAFGEMHGDGYLWSPPHPIAKVIVEQWQSYRHIHILHPGSYHIRALAYAGNYPRHRSAELTGITEAKFRQHDYLPKCHPAKQWSLNNRGFTYGDARDKGYILSMGIGDFASAKTELELKYARGLLESQPAKDVNDHTISGIRSIETWLHYLDNPEDLE